MADKSWKIAFALAAALGCARPAFAQDAGAPAAAAPAPAVAISNEPEGPVREPVVEPVKAPEGPSAEDKGRIKDYGPHQRPMAVSGMLEMPWVHGIGIGVGARFEIPVLKNGPIKSLNNQISVEPGFTVGYYRGYGGYGVRGSDYPGVVYLTPIVYGLWSFHFSEKLRAYGGLGIGADIGIPDSDTKDRYRLTVKDYTWVRIEPVVGMFYKFAPNIAFRAELGAYGPKVGIGYLL